MRAFIAKHWAALSVAAFINGSALWKGLLWLWDWLSRLDLVANHAGELREVGGMLTFVTNPPPWAIFVTLPIAVLIVLWDVRHPQAISRAAGKYRMAFLLGGMVLCLLGAGILGALAYRAWKYPPPPEEAKSELLRHAENDFRHNGGMSFATEKFKLQLAGLPEVEVKIWIHSDLIAMAKFLVFYVPTTFDTPSSPPIGGFSMVHRSTYDVTKGMADRFQNVIQAADARGNSGMGDMGTDNWRYSTDAPFTGAIYIYYEGNLTEAERVELRKIYKEKGANAYFRDRRYLVESRPPQTH